MRKYSFIFILATIVLSLLFCAAIAEQYDRAVLSAKYQELSADHPQDDLTVHLKSNSGEEESTITSVDQQFMKDLATALEKRWLLSNNTPSDMDDEKTVLIYNKLVDAELNVIGKYTDVEFEDSLLNLFAHTYLQALQNQKEGITNHYGTKKYDSLWDTNGLEMRRLSLYLLNRFYKVVIDPKFKSNMSDFIVSGYLQLPEDPIAYCCNFLNRYSAGAEDEPVNTPRPATTPEPTAKPDQSKYSTVSKGMKGDNVTKLQNKLVELGYMTKTTTSYDKATISAVNKFQTYNSLPVEDDATPKMQALLFSNRTDVNKIPDLEITDIGLRTKYGTNYLRPVFMNHTDNTITSVRFRIKAYNYSNQRIMYNVLDVNDILSYDNTPNYNLDNSTFEINGLSIKSNKKVTLNGRQEIALYSFDTSKTKTLYIAVTGYQTASGRSVSIPENNQIWIGSNGDVKKWQYMNNTSKVPKLTNQIENTAKQFSLGIYTNYIDNFFCEVANAPIGGAYISSFDYESILQEAGVSEGDILVKIGDVWIKDYDSLLVAKGYVKPGESTIIQYIHRGKLMEIEMVLY